ncbi:GNAT family N-acetyltransferase [Alkalimarinus alittae]|uniref:GNAT family N-acetyltransferase n=1 Tax=Alkalimarinus alittae TaxID=2961619 RepID=A0ABY6MX28_9ALTE|nr:GNAT family N-acetyltransferase [Alkalimarinus alittae]UZE94378.1 GNAT family N-acetyltransferase [Alkalimarinus alittae]
MGRISKPEPLRSVHDLSRFSCGIDSLDQWLKTRALKNERINASRTYVVCDELRVAGYYCLATGSIEHNESPSKVKRNMPSPIPVMILGRLAVDIDYQDQKIGKGLLKDAVLRTILISEQVGVKAMLVHAINDSARYFYKAHGFIESPFDPMKLLLPTAKKV